MKLNGKFKINYSAEVGQNLKMLEERKNDERGREWMANFLKIVVNAGNQSLKLNWKTPFTNIFTS